MKHAASDRRCQTYHSDCRPLLGTAAWWKLHPGPCSPTTLCTSSTPPSSPPSPLPTSPACCFHHPSGAQSSPAGLQVRGCWLGQWRLTLPVCWLENVTVEIEQIEKFLLHILGKSLMNETNIIVLAFISFVNLFFVQSLPTVWLKCHHQWC